MTLVLVGANPTVARALGPLPGGVVHVQLPGAPELGPGLPGVVAVLTADYRDAPAFEAFVREVLKPLAPAAVVSLTELGLAPAADAARALGAVGVAPEVVAVTRDKLAMRRLLERTAPHLNPGFAAGDDADGVARLFAAHTPVIVKPVDGVGSRAVERVERLADLRPERRTAETLLEQYVGGAEFSVEALSRRGRHTCVGIAEKGTGPGFVEVSHMMPPPSLSRVQRARVEEAVGELLDAVGLTDGPSHTEVKVDGDLVVVIETHTRLGGDGLADLVELTSGLNWRRAAIGWAVDVRPEAAPAAAPAAASVFFTAPPGRVAAVAAQPVPRHGTVVAWEVQARPGDTVRPLASSDDRLGTARLTAGSPAECRAAVAEILGTPVVTTY